MLTLIKGKARKSVYMSLLHKGLGDSLFIQYGHEFHLLNADENCWNIKRRESTKTDIERLKEELWMLMEQIMNTTEFKNVFLYGNFGLHEIGTLRDVNDKVDGRLNLTVSIQDELVSDGQLIIQEL